MVCFFTAWERSTSSDVRLNGGSASPTTDRREAVMRYNTKEEIESTKEWFLRIKEAGFSEELMCVPSELNKLGIAPIDVVDRLDWLREIKDHGNNESDHDIIEVDEPVGDPVADIPIEEPPVFSSAYEGYGDWEWDLPIEKLIENSFNSMLELEPDLPAFNGLAILTRSRRRARGKRARASRIPQKRANELVSNSARAT